VDAEERHGGMVLEKMWNNFDSSNRIHRTRRNGEGKSMGQLANPGSPEKMAVKMVFVCV